MKLKPQWAGLVILICVALSAFAVDHLGRSRQPAHVIVMFKTGDQFDQGAEVLIEKIAAMMAVTPSYEAIIVGHSGTRGDPAVNKELSRNRAEMVKKALINKGVPPSRMKAFGVGGQDPLEKKPGEGPRSYSQRLKRAEVTLRLP